MSTNGNRKVPGLRLRERVKSGELACSEAMVILDSKKVGVTAQRGGGS